MDSYQKLDRGTIDLKGELILCTWKNDSIVAECSTGGEHVICPESDLVQSTAQLASLAETVKVEAATEKVGVAGPTPAAPEVPKALIQSGAEESAREPKFVAPKNIAEYRDQAADLVYTKQANLITGILPTSAGFDNQDKGLIYLLGIPIMNDVPALGIYLYPLCAAVFLGLVWFTPFLGCRGSARLGLGLQLLCETALCFGCMWADNVTKFNYVSATRAWSHLVALVIVCTAWNLTLILAVPDKLDKETVHYIFAPLMVFVWIVFSLERMVARKFFRRTADRMSGDSSFTSIADFISVCLCPQYSALEESKFLAGIVPPDVVEQKEQW